MSFDSDIEDEEIKKPKDEFDKMRDLTMKLLNMENVFLLIYQV